jgi:hypothetical protein
MTSPFEDELRATLGEHAALMPADTADRLAQIDYWPASPRRVRVWPIAGAAGVAVACCAVIAVLLFSSSSGPLGVSMAYAGWSATPTKPTPTVLAKAIAACNWLANDRSAAKLVGRRVLTDERRKYVAVIYVSGTRESDCISDGRHTSTGVGFNDGILKRYAAPGPDQLGLASGGGGPAPGFPGGRSGHGVYENTMGLAGSNIIAVTFRFGDRMTVEATVQNGWYFAWWPNTDYPTSVQLRTKSGSTITSPLNCKTGVRGCAFAGFDPLARRSRSGRLPSSPGSAA